VTNLPCSLLPGDIEAKTEIFQWSEIYTVNIAFHVTSSPLVINETAENQSTTAKNSNIVYDVSKFFMNYFNVTFTFDTPTLKNGDNLPSWITFDSTSKIFTATTDSLGNVEVRVTGRMGTSSIYQDFNVSITNSQPLVNSILSPIEFYENMTLNYPQDLQFAFVDLDPNQYLSFSFLNVPTFLNSTLLNTTLILDGFPSLSDVGVYNLTVRATDTFSYTDQNLTIVIKENFSPTPPATFSDINVFEGVSHIHTVEAFTDAESNPITYSMTFSNGSALDSSWITFDGPTRNVSVTAPSTINSPVLLKVFANDNFNPSTSGIVTLRINFKPKDNSTMIMRTGEFICLTHSTVYISKYILYDDDTITNYAFTLANGTAAPPWIQMTIPSVSASGNFEFNGTYPVFENKIYEFKLTATDSNGLIGSANFFIEAKCKYLINLQCTATLAD
jgi:hypothetical protein